MADVVFVICTLGVIPFWLLLVLAPTWRWTQSVVHSIFPFTLFALAYIWAQSIGGEPPVGAGFTSLEGVTLLFSNKAGMLTAWIHFIIVDMFIGAWMVRDAMRHGIRHLWIVPILLITFMLAPVGLTVYLVLRTIRTRGTVLSELPRG